MRFLLRRNDKIIQINLLNEVYKGFKSKKKDKKNLECGNTRGIRTTKLLINKGF
jgi:hypothetical protein